MTDLEDAQQRFFETGARNFVQALLALDQFRVLVQDACRDVLRTRLNDLSNAAQVPIINDENIFNFWFPIIVADKSRLDRERSDGKYSSLLGVVTNLAQTAQLVCGMLSSFDPEARTSAAFACSTLLVWSFTQRQSAIQKLRLQGRDFANPRRADRADIAVFVPLNGAMNLGTFHEELNSTLQRWIDTLRESGGIGALLGNG